MAFSVSYESDFMAELILIGLFAGILLTTLLAAKALAMMTAHQEAQQFAEAQSRSMMYAAAHPPTASEILTSAPSNAELIPSFAPPSYQEVVNRK